MRFSVLLVSRCERRHAHEAQQNTTEPHEVGNEQDLITPKLAERNELSCLNVGWFFCHNTVRVHRLVFEGYEYRTGHNHIKETSNKKSRLRFLKGNRKFGR